MRAAYVCMLSVISLVGIPFCAACFIHALTSFTNDDSAAAAHRGRERSGRGQRATGEGGAAMFDWLVTRACRLRLS